MDIISRTPFDYDRGAVDTAYFGRRAVPELICDEPAPWHVQLWDILEVGEDPYYYVVAPRHHSKTTTLQIHILKRFAYAPKGFTDHVGIVSESGESQAERSVEDIKNVLASGEEFARLFPAAAGKGSTWGATEIITAGGHRLAGYGSRQKIRGVKYHGIRFRLILGDDFESPEEDSALERARIKRWMFGAAKYALHSPTGRMVVIGTETFDDSMLATVRRTKRWKGLFLRAKWRDGDPHRELYDEHGMLWGKPHRNQDGDLVAFDREWYDQARADAIDEGQLALFNREIDNELTSSEEDFDSSKFQHYSDLKFEDGIVLVKPSAEEPYRPVRVAIGVDSSTREHEDADWCVLMPVGMDSDRNAYQLPYVRKRYGKDVTKICEDIFELHRMYGFRRAAVETIQAQVYIEGELKRQMPERDQWFTVVPKNPRKGKDARVYSIKPRVDAGRLKFHPTVNEQLVYELGHYRSSKFKDCADALAMALERDVISPWRGLVEALPTHVTNQYGVDERVRWDWMTERWLPV